MAELDWDDPNYVEPTTKYYHHTYESSTQQQRSDDDDYARGRRSGYRSRDPTSESYGNKRHAPYDRTGDFSSSDYSESITISTDMVGRIIGRGGSNISRIQNEYNVRIKVDKVELIVKVSGENQTNVSDATNQLRKQVESEPSERRSRFDDNKSSYGGGGGGGYGGGRSSFNFAPAAPADIPADGDLTGTIDWQALNRASVSYSYMSYFSL